MHRVFGSCGTVRSVYVMHSGVQRKGGPDAHVVDMLAWNLAYAHCDAAFPNLKM